MSVMVLRAVLVYILVVFAIRVMGKRQVGDLQPGELVITILISEAAVLPLENGDQPLLVGVVAIFTLVIMELLTSLITMKSIRARRLINGRSVLLIAEGRVDHKAMRRLRVTVPDLMELLRCQNVFDISTVAYAILETNGQLSVLLKNASQPATAKDVGVQATKSGYPALVVSDGVLLQDSIALVGATPARVRQLLGKKGLKPKQVLLMTLDKYGKHVVLPKEDAK